MSGFPVGLEFRVVAAGGRGRQVRRLGDAERAAERVLVVDVVEDAVDFLFVNAGAREPGDLAGVRRIEPELLAPVFDVFSWP